MIVTSQYGTLPAQLFAEMLLNSFGPMPGNRGGGKESESEENHEAEAGPKEAGVE